MAGSEEDREQLKIFRSPNASFERDAQNAATVYTEHVLSGLADSDFNGIWIRGIFHQLLRHPAFPEFGADAKGLQASLETVISRAACHGIKVSTSITRSRLACRSNIRSGRRTRRSAAPSQPTASTIGPQALPVVVHPIGVVVLEVEAERYSSNQIDQAVPGKTTESLE